MSEPLPSLAQRVIDATAAVFGETSLTAAVHQACKQYAHDLSNIQAGRGINALLVAIVGAKGQGKTWVARQLVRDERLRSLLLSGDLRQDATTRLVWIGPTAPQDLDPTCEIYHYCSAEQLAAIGQPYVLLDTPGLTDADAPAAKLAQQSLSLAPLKLLVIARDQLRAAANLTIAHQIDGAAYVPIITSVEPEEFTAGAEAERLAQDLRELRGQLEASAPHSRMMPELLIPDFEATGDEAAAGEALLHGVLDRFNDLGIAGGRLGNAQEQRATAATDRLKSQVAKLIHAELPQLHQAVEQLHRETRQLPERVLDSLLGSSAVLSTGVRMRLRARLVGDTSLIWFPYRTMMSTLHLTQGAWDRVVLAMAGSVPSLFGALASWAKNVRQNREFTAEIQDGIRRRTQQQLEERLRPLCERFHRAVLKLRSRGERGRDSTAASGMRLTGIEELQNRSQQIFDAAIDRHATAGWLVQLWALIGVTLFWLFMAGPFVLIYREYFHVSYQVLSGAQAMRLEDFPHPSPALLLTSLLLSLLPLTVYCMVVLTLSLSRRKVQHVTRLVTEEHQRVIAELKVDRVIRLEYDDPLLEQAEFLLTLHD